MASFRLSNAIRNEIATLYYEFLFGEVLRNANEILMKQLYNLYVQATDHELHNTISSNSVLSTLDVFYHRPIYAILPRVAINEFDDLQAHMGIRASEIFYIKPDIPNLLRKLRAYYGPIHSLKHDMRLSINKYGPSFTYAPRKINDVQTYELNNTPEIGTPTSIVFHRGIFDYPVLKDTSLEPEIRRLIILMSFYSSLIQHRIIPKMKETESALLSDLDRCLTSSQVALIRPDVAAVMALLQQNYDLTPTGIRTQMAKVLGEEALSWDIEITQDLEEELMKHRLTLNVDHLMEAS